MAVNNNPAAPVFDVSDIGIAADWRDAVPALVTALRSHLGMEQSQIAARLRL